MKKDSSVEARRRRSHPLELASGDFDAPFERLRRDITHLQARLAELETVNRELRESQGDDSSRGGYWTLYHDSPAAHVVVDKDELILRANSAAGELLGMPERRLVNKPFHLFVQRETLNEYRAFCREAILTRQRVACRILLRLRGRDPVRARLEMEGIRCPESGKPVCHMAIVELGAQAATAEPVPWALLPAVDGATGTCILWGDEAHGVNSAIDGIRSALMLAKSALPEDHPYIRFVPVAENKLDFIASTTESDNRVL